MGCSGAEHSVVSGINRHLRSVSWINERNRRSIHTKGENANESTLWTWKCIMIKWWVVITVEYQNVLEQSLPSPLTVLILILWGKSITCNYMYPCNLIYIPVFTWLLFSPFSTSALGLQPLRSVSGSPHKRSQSLASLDGVSLGQFSHSPALLSLAQFPLWLARGKAAVGSGEQYNHPSWRLLSRTKCHRSPCTCTIPCTSHAHAPLHAQSLHTHQHAQSLHMHHHMHGPCTCTIPCTVPAHTPSHSQSLHTHLLSPGRYPSAIVLAWLLLVW